MNALGGKLFAATQRVSSDCEQNRPSISNKYSFFAVVIYRFPPFGTFSRAFHRDNITRGAESSSSLSSFSALQAIRLDI
jgi:hypothetical protein